MPLLQQRARVADEGIEHRADGFGSANPEILDRLAADPWLELFAHSDGQSAPHPLEQVRSVVLRILLAESRQRVASRQRQRRERFGLRRFGELIGTFYFFAAE
jgi:hypothetical protein